jgi:ribosome biogenesis GTPase
LSALPGTVVALQANYLEVELDAAPPGIPRRLLCTRRTRLSHQGAAVYVGDRVHLEAVDAQEARAVVSGVDPRSSWLSRPPVANVTAVLVALAVDQPSFDPDQASRFLLTAERTGLSVQLLLTKCDLISCEQQEEYRVRLRGWGYEPLLLSSQTGEGISALKERLLSTSLAVVCGPSGVGKSSALNRLMPQLSLRVGSVSGRLQRGRHTTRHVELFPLVDGVRVADTPGFNRPDLPDDPRELALLFPELRQQLQEWPCRFRDCLHRGEPGCGVQTDWERYSFYLRTLEAMAGSSRSSRGD